MPSIQSHFYRTIIALSTRPLKNGSSIERQRAYVTNGTRWLKPPRGASVAPVTAGDVPAFWIAAKGVATERVLLYIHGGGFVLGWNNQYFGWLHYLSKTSNARILAIDYRLAPEHPFPAALDDCVAAYRWLLAQGVQPRQLAIGGDSAGGNLTLTTLLALRDAGVALPAAGVCLSPGTDFTISGESFQQNQAIDPVLNHRFIHEALQAYVGTADPRNPLLSPIFADLHGLPPLLIQVGSDELLLSDARRVTERAQAAGVAVTLSVFSHMWHVFQMFAPSLPEARQAVNALGAFISQKSPL